MGLHSQHECRQAKFFRTGVVTRDRCLELRERRWLRHPRYRRGRGEDAWCGFLCGFFIDVEIVRFFRVFE